jgi:NADH-quinone oxidoreductase subunit H
MMEILIAIPRVIIYSIVAMAIGLLFMGLGRKISARLHRRIGPPFWQTYIDVIKAFSRNSVSYNYVMDFGSMMGLAGLLAAAMFVPYAGWLPFKTDGPIVLILYLMPIGYLGMAMCVSASGNPLATIGIGRALTLMLGYEVPFAIIVLSFVASMDTTSLVALNNLQQAGGSILDWNVFSMPIGFIASLLILQAMLAKKPFDTMIAPAEIASGPMVELSGKFLGLAFLQHSAAIFLETGLIVILFLGGASNIFFFFLKQLGLYLFATLLSEIFGRYKVEQAVKFLWVSAGGLALIQLIISITISK